MVVDLVYHPAVTPWMAAAADQGARVTNGLGMLVHQAALQIERWTACEAPVEAMWASVPGLAAKPIIDILISVVSLATAKATMVGEKAGVSEMLKPP